MTLSPRNLSSGGIIRLFCFPYPVSLLSLGIFNLFLFPIPSRFLFLGYIQPVSLPYTQWLSFPWVYPACFPSLYPVAFFSLGILGLFSLSTPALSVIPGLISLLFLPTPHSIDFSGAYLASLALYAPIHRSFWGLFRFFSSLRPAHSIFPGLIFLLFLSTPRSLHFPGAYFASFDYLCPHKKTASGDTTILSP